jgi:hypothetical protein
MLGVRHLALITGLALAAPSAAIAQVRPQWNAPSSTAYNEGFARGRSAGAEDFRRGQRFNFADETDYRRGDYGYRSQYGNRDRYRDDFRRGFAEGYRAGYARTDFRSTPYYTPAPAPYPNAGFGAPGANFGYSGGAYLNRNDLAASTGYDDGYREGLNDGRSRHRDDPFAESRYRGGDHGYQGWYGPRDLYRTRYRDAFRAGYEAGYRDGFRY